MSNLRNSSVKFFNLILAVICSTLLIGVTIFAEGVKTNDSKEITWHAYDKGLKLAKENDKQIIIDFTAKWCRWCKEMERKTFVDPQVVKTMNENFVAVRVDGDSHKELDISGYKITEQQLTKQEFRVTGFPAFWFLESDGTKIGPIKGYKPAEQFLSVLNYVKDRKYDTTQTKQKTQNKEN